MNYEELRSLVGGSSPKSASYEDIISAIQSQYRPQTQFAPTRSLLDSLGTLVADQPRIAYGSLLQAQPRKLPEKFDITKYQTKADTVDTSIIDTAGGGGDATSASSGNTAHGVSMSDEGNAVANTNSAIAAAIASIATGLPIGIVNSINNAIATNNAAALNAAIAAADADSTATGGIAATAGATGTGAAAAAAGTAAAAAATAAGMSDSAAAAAGQAAADAAIGGASAAAAAAAGAAAAAAADSAGNSGVAGDNGPSGVGDGVGDGTAFYKGGIVTMDRLMGINPVGQDDGYASLKSGEYVIKKDAVDKYGEEFLGLLNSGKLTKKQINSLL
jgi:hypothetical protein